MKAQSPNPTYLEQLATRDWMVGLHVGILTSGLYYGEAHVEAHVES